MNIRLLNDRISDLEVQDTRLDNRLETAITLVEEAARLNISVVSGLEARVLRLESGMIDLEGDLERVDNEG